MSIFTGEASHCVIRANKIGSAVPTFEGWVVNVGKFRQGTSKFAQLFHFLQPQNRALSFFKNQTAGLASSPAAVN